MVYSGIMVITREHDYAPDYGAVKRVKNCVSLNSVEILLGDFIRTSGIIEDRDIKEDAVNDFYQRIQKNINGIVDDKPVRIHFDAEYSIEGGTYSIEAEIVAK